MLSRYGRAKILVANNVFAHIDDLDGTMSAVVEVLREDGVFVFEVHYQGNLIGDFQFDTVYHEHLCYYSLQSLVGLLGGSTSQSSMWNPSRSIPGRSSGSGTGGLEAAGQRRRPQDAGSREKLGHCAFRLRRPGTLRHGAKAHSRPSFRRPNSRRLWRGRCATVLLNYCKLGPALIDYVVDMSPLRHGRLVSGVRVPVRPTETFQRHYPDYALMTAWNYESEIAQKERAFLAAGGRFIVPLPHVRISGEC